MKFAFTQRSKAVLGKALYMYVNLKDNTAWKIYGYAIFLRFSPHSRLVEI